MRVKFIDIGANKRCFETECKSKLTREWLLKQIKPHILSSCIDFYNMEDGKIAVFVGAVRKVGEIEVMDD